MDKIFNFNRNDAMFVPLLFQIYLRERGDGEERQGGEGAQGNNLLFGSLSNLHLVRAQVVDPDPAGYECFGQCLYLDPDPEFSQRSNPVFVGWCIIVRV